MSDPKKSTDDLETSLESLRAYRKRDPHSERAIADWVDAEASLKDDPAEGAVTPVAGLTSGDRRGLDRSALVELWHCLPAVDPVAFREDVEAAVDSRLPPQESTIAAG